jgi:predicted small secreted protein
LLEETDEIGMKTVSFIALVLAFSFNLVACETGADVVGVDLSFVKGSPSSSEVEARQCQMPAEALAAAK